MAKNDISAAQFFESAKTILAEHIEDIDKDLARILKYIEKDSETELLTTW